MLTVSLFFSFAFSFYLIVWDFFFFFILTLYTNISLNLVLLRLSYQLINNTNFMKSQRVWQKIYKELTPFLRLLPLPLQEINTIASLFINKVNGKKGVSIEDKKQKASNAKIVNGFRVTVMILMDSGLLNDAYPT